MPSYSSHVVLNGPAAWGHMRGLSSLAAKIAAERPVVVTLLVPNSMDTFERSEVEARRGFSSYDKPKGELRVIGLGQPLPPDPALTALAQKDDFAPVWRALLEQSSITCSATGKTFDGTIPPQLVILDGVQYALFDIIRSSKPAPPILLWQFGSAAGLAAGGLLTPRIKGSKLDAVLFDEFTPEEQAAGRDLLITGEVINVPGLPQMYDWENYPYVLPWMGTGQKTLYVVHLYLKALYSCDGLVTACAPAYDGEELLQEYDAWAKRRNVPIYHVGPMQPTQQGSSSFREETVSLEMNAGGADLGRAVTTFLDAASDKSILYVCFGSAFWPALNQGHLWAAVEMLATKNIPFILSHPSLMAVVPDNIKDRFAPGGSSTNKGLVVPWAPQQAILAHKAVGWFLTHGGAGGSMEGVGHGVPMIGWPIMGDQPANIAYLTHKADVAFELIEGRTGDLGLRPMLTTGKTPSGTLEAFIKEFESVLSAMQGEEGARKRANVKRMQAELARAWSEGGSARRAFDAFCTKFEF